MSHFGIARLVSAELTERVIGDALGDVKVAGSQQSTHWVGFDAASTLRLVQQALSEDTDGDEWFDQHRSPLIAHCSTVRARIEAGLPGAKIDGQRYLLSTGALAEELANGTT